MGAPSSPVIVFMAVEEFELLKALDAPATALAREKSEGVTMPYEGAA